MASLALSWSSTATGLPSQPLFSIKPPHSSTYTTRTRRCTWSCKANNGGQNEKHSPQNVETSQGKLDRRNLLLGMGGLYGAAANLVSDRSPALATPITSPDLSKCSTGTNLNTQQPLDVNCCPPVSKEIIDYKLPPVGKMRFRPAAHLAGEDYYAKFEKAVELMKALPPEDPRNFMQQANVHCAYCNLTYQQTGDPKLKLQIHNCWHFFPWHRWYLYFFERILGKLIDDPTFGLPFWNWDNPDGMIMPEVFARKHSPLFDARRNTSHLPPALADLAYSSKSPTNPKKIIPNNLTVMYGEMVRNVSKLEDFYGAKYVVGTAPDPGPGSVERGSHMALHGWVGENTPTGEDMGNFYSTARDPIFYSHHTNVDRLWTVWRGLRGPKPKDFPDSDWLDADFLFYDENAQLVRVKVVDTLDNEKMGYVYQDVDLPWLKNRPLARVKKSKAASSSGAPAAETVFPVKLNKVVKVLVKRPKKSRSKKDKEKEEELLVIEGIEVDTAKFVKFDVFVNDEDDKPDELDKAEYAGCYSQVPHKNSTKVKTKIRLG
ncbi:Polyphenol oxidase, chloroplastic [Sesamum angolense]|uniref:Polyphenol oxidase, chloroplastic n=1 Tax=Sesamum angolense TaxID=2727404 RepID=A0AAE2BJ14_9LAMI|nr:Polyphenol oxidase, chloroplastic [Sesamum angolense]